MRQGGEGQNPPPPPGGILIQQQPLDQPMAVVNPQHPAAVVTRAGGVEVFMPRHESESEPQSQLGARMI